MSTDLVPVEAHLADVLAAVRPMIPVQLGLEEYPPSAGATGVAGGSVEGTRDVDAHCGRCARMGGSGPRADDQLAVDNLGDLASGTCIRSP